MVEHVTLGLYNLLIGGIIIKIAVISDIHSNAIALNSVLEDIKSRKCDLIWSLGDYIGEASDPDQVIDLLAINKIPMIIGNRESKLLQYYQGHLPQWDNSLQYAGLVWNYNKLESRHFEMISSLPEEFRVNICGINILGNHGTQDQLAGLLGYDLRNEGHVREINMLCDLGPSSVPGLVDMLLEKFPFNIYLCGHSHIPAIIRKGRKMYINSGSVCTPIHVDPGYSTYALLQIEEQNYSAQIVYVKKDVDAVEKRNRETGYEAESGMIGRLAIFEMRTGRSCSMDFIQYVYGLAQDRLGYLPDVIPNDIWMEAVNVWTFPNVYT